MLGQTERCKPSITGVRSNLQVTHSLVRRVNAIFAISSEGERQANIFQRVITILLFTLIPFTILIIAGWIAGFYEPDGPVTILLLDLAMVVCWWMAKNGRWRPGSFIPPVIFYLIGLFVSYISGLDTVGVLFYVIAILLAAQLLGNYSQWLFLALSLASHLSVSWIQIPSPSVREWLTTASMLSAAFIGISLLQRFFTRQLKSAYELLEERAKELQKSNQILSMEIEDRRRAENALRESEARFRTAFQTSPDAIFIISFNDGTYLDINEGFTALTGISRSDAVGKAVFNINIWSDIQDRHHLYNELKQKGVVQNMEARFIRYDGHLRTCLVSARMIFLKDIPHILCMLRDIEDRKHAEKALLESEGRYRSLFESNQSVMLLIDPESAEIVDANQAACQYYGYTRDILTNKKLTDINTLPRTSLLEELQEAAQGNQRYTYNLHRLGSGELRDVEVYSGPLMLEGKQLLYSIVHDISDRVQREREMEAILKVAEAMRSAKNRAGMMLNLLQSVCELWDAQGVVLGVHDEKTHATIIEMTTGPASPDNGLRLPSGVGALGQVIQSGKPTLVNESKPSDHPFINEPKIALACAPLKSGEGTLGAILVGCKKAFTEADLRLLSMIGEIAANAVQRATLFEETQRRLQHLNALHTIDMAIAGSTEMKGTLNTVLDQVVGQLGVDATDILLNQPSAMMLKYAARRGYRQTVMWETEIRIDKGLAGQVARRHRQVYIPDLQASDIFEDPRAATWRQEGFVSYFGVPLIAKGQVKGVLELFHRTPLHPDEEWLNYLDILAGQTAIAIDNASLFEGLQKANLELVLAYDVTLEGWAKALELRDKETQGHSERVTEMTIRLARQMGFDEESLVHVRRGALLHDIGKMGIPDSVLQKPGPLDEEEWQIMKLHPGYAYDLLSPIDFLKPALDIPYCHHERWDGKGYPRNLSGENIPLAARVFTVVDVWDALRSDRPYREPWPDEKVYVYLRENASIQFDSQVVQAFLELVERDQFSMANQLIEISELQTSSLSLPNAVEEYKN